MSVKEYTNRLINEKSPYLLQHAHNPVDWYPWGNEAFKKAKSEDKPIFLSVGYSTCHWCHVMAHESFEDNDVAKALNRDFVSIKVDREERPDVDAVYMSVCQAMTGSGGWPLTVIMTPEQKPFWAGTYLPKDSRYGMNGLIDLLSIVAQQWKANRKKLTAAGDEVASLLSRPEKRPTEAKVGKDTLHEAYSWFHRAYDEQWGGFGNAPKFPAPHNLMFLLKYAALENDKEALLMVEHTLTQMYRGGIFDHIGGGFSRYSTDEKWLVPHFEKMLYDNALIAEVCIEAFRMTRRPLYKKIAERLFDYVLRELTDKDGGFYCGQDADSDGVEGKYYVFTPEEIKGVLGQNDGDAFCKWFSISEKGNFEHKNIPNLIENPDYEKTPQNIEKFCQKLYAFRLERTKLHKDDKVLTSWNALMIGALADASRLFSEPRFLDAAKKAWNFITEHLLDSERRLLHRWRDEEAAGDGQLDDYAFSVNALLKLYEATFDANYLSAAVELAEKMTGRFFDEKDGGFFLYAKDSEQLISRPKEVYDGAMPSGNSAAALALAKLFRLTGEKKWLDYSEKQFSYLSGYVREFPSGHSAALIAFASALYSSRELVCVTAEKTAADALAEALRQTDGLFLSVLLKTEDNKATLAKAAPFTADYPFAQSGSSYYLCQNGSCSAPIYSLQDLKKALQK